MFDGHVANVVFCYFQDSIVATVCPYLKVRLNVKLVGDHLTHICCSSEQRWAVFQLLVFEIHISTALSIL